MENKDIYQSWRNKLLSGVGEKICRPCTDDKKIKYKLDYDNPLNCGCRCEQVESVLNNVKNIEINKKKLKVTG